MAAIPFRITPANAVASLTPAAPAWVGSTGLSIWTKGTLNTGSGKESIEAPLVVMKQYAKQLLQPSGKSVGWHLEFHPVAFPGAAQMLIWLSVPDDVLLLRSHNCATRLTLLCEALCEEGYWHNSAILDGLLEALLALLAETRQTADRTSRTTELPPAANQFLTLLEQHYKEPESAAFYAKKLNISPRHLNRLCQTSFGCSTVMAIENRKLTAARQLLTETDKTVAEIGFELGYNEKSYFTRVFRRKTGLTPTIFRLQHATRVV